MAIARGGLACRSREAAWAPDDGWLITGAPARVPLVTSPPFDRACNCTGQELRRRLLRPVYYSLLYMADLHFYASVCSARPIPAWPLLKLENFSRAFCACANVWRASSCPSKNPRLRVGSRPYGRAAQGGTVVQNSDWPALPAGPTRRGGMPAENSCVLLKSAWEPHTPTSQQFCNFCRRLIIFLVTSLRSAAVEGVFSSQFSMAPHRNAQSMCN